MRPTTAPTPPRAPVRGTCAARSRAAVWGLLFVAVVICICAVALLYYYWLTVPEPSTGLIISGHPIDAGATVRVSGAELSEPLSVIVTPGLNQTARFYLQPGHYTFTVAQPGQREQPAEIAGGSLTLRAGQIVRVTVTEAPTTRP